MSKAAMPSAQVAAQIIEKASKEGRRVIDEADYDRKRNAIVVKCGPLWLCIDVSLVQELSGVSPDDLNDITLSPGGATIKLEKHNIYIEAASLVVESINQLNRRKSGGLIMDLLEHGGYRI